MMVNFVPDNFIQELLSRVDIVDVIGARISLKKRGKNYLAKCPFHNEKTASFTVDQIKQFYHCFGCGVNGNAITFLRELDKLTFIEAIEQLAQQVGMTIPIGDAPKQKEPIAKELYDLLEIVAKFFVTQLKTHPAASNAISYLKKRGLNGEIAKKFQLGYAPSGWDKLKQYILQQTKFSSENLEKVGLLIVKENNSYDRFRNRIIFPIRDRQGRIVGFGGRVLDNTDPKYLNSPETPIFNKGRELYGLYEARQQQKLTKLIVVEGYMDVLALVQAKITNVVAVLGTALTADNVKMLFRMVSEITFCFDADNAGRKAAWRALMICLPMIKANLKINFLFLPESEDPDSYVRKYGREKFLEVLQRSTPWPDFLFKTLAAEKNLDAAEDKASLAVTAKELFQQLPDQILQNMMFDRLSNLIGLDKKILTTEQKKYSSPKLQKQISKTQFPKSPTTLALGLLLIEPKLKELLLDFDIDYYQTVELPGSKLFFEVAKIMKKNPNASIEEITNLLPPEQGRRFIPEELSKLATFVPALVIKEEFIGIIEKIKTLHEEQVLEDLLTKSKEIGLSQAEKEHLQQLLERRNNKNVNNVAEII